MAVADVGTRLRQLLVMLPWLAERGEVPLAEVAARFEMPLEEVVPLLERAACCGLPPYTPDQLIELVLDGDRVQARPGHHLARARRLSPQDGLVLASAARALLTAPGAEADGPLRRALTKLEAALDAAGVLAVAADRPVFVEPARAALDAGRQISLLYYSAGRDEMTERVVDPLAVYLAEGHWYLDGWCHRVGGLRHFRLDRVRALTETGRPAAPHPDVGGQIGRLRPGAGSLEVVLDVPGRLWPALEPYGPLEVDPEAPVDPGEPFDPGDPGEPRRSGRLVATEPNGRDTARPLAGPAGGPGRRRGRLWFSGRASLERLLLALGPEARVVWPAELADVAARRAATMLGRYRPSDGPEGPTPGGLEPAGQASD